MLFVIVAWLMVPVTGVRSLLATAMGATSSAWQKRWLSFVYAISTWPAACAGLACVQHALAGPDSQSLGCTRVYFLCDILWPEVQSHSDNSHMPATYWSMFCTCTHSGSPYSVMHSFSLHANVCWVLSLWCLCSRWLLNLSILSSGGSLQGGIFTKLSTSAMTVPSWWHSFLSRHCRTSILRTLLTRTVGKA